MPRTALAPPRGFTVFERQSPLVEPWRPIYALAKPDRLVLGVSLREPHMNSRGSPHGGFLAALADWAMGMSCGVQLRAKGLEVKTLWTSSLTVDYLGRAKADDWLTFDTHFTKIGRSLCHAGCDIAADWETIARARGAFQVQLSSSS